MSRCETCGGEGFCIEFRRFAGEYQAGEPYEIPCPDCLGNDDEPGVPFDYAAHIRGLIRARDEQLSRDLERDLRFTMSLQRKAGAR